MTEAFLHYLWEHRLFDVRKLSADDGSSVEILKPGILNTGSGPDFFNAQLRINGISWAGNVEIHIRTSDWHRHDHHRDPVYDSVVLHVVYENDGTTLRMNGSPIPTIELKNKFPDHLWENYLSLLGKHGWVSCDHYLKDQDEMTVQRQLSDMMHERLMQRSKQILIGLKGLTNDWEECFYQLLAKNFGFHVNALPMEMLARTLPLKIILRERSSLLNVEALLFGQSGLLPDKNDSAYINELNDRYSLFKDKYYLKNILATSWKFMRLRPVNFPTVRLAQFSDLLFRSQSLLSKTLSANSLPELCELLECTPSPYWTDRYTFREPAEPLVKKIGVNSVHNLLINTVLPIFVAWSEYGGEKIYKIRAMELLQQIPPEENAIMNGWIRAGIHPRSAFESQALLQLKFNYCSEKKCLSCSIGNKLINSLP